MIVNLFIIYSDLQRYLFKDCRLIKGISNFFKENVMLEPGMKRHLPVTGHVVLIAQVTFPH